jgi:hypothetical protein
MSSSEADRSQNETAMTVVAGKLRAAWVEPFRQGFANGSKEEKHRGRKEEDEERKRARKHPDQIHSSLDLVQDSSRSVDSRAGREETNF